MEDRNNMNDLELQRSLGRVEGQLNSLHTKVDQLTAKMTRTDTLVETRLTDLEHWQVEVLSKAKTVAAVMSLAVSAVVLTVQWIWGL